VKAIVIRLLKEPVRVAACIRACIYCGMAFGLDLTVEQLGALMIAVELVLMEITRAIVEPVQK
jgi:hypothetical protein